MGDRDDGARPSDAGGACGRRWSCTACRGGRPRGGPAGRLTASPEPSLIRGAVLERRLLLGTSGPPNGELGALDYVVRDVIRPALAAAGIPWDGLHAFRRGLATNLHDLGIADIVIQAILRHSNVSVTRACYVLNDAVDPQSLAAMEALESAVCNQNATGASEAESGTDVTR